MTDLPEREEQCQVTVDAIFSLENLGSLDTLPCTGELDKNSVFADACFLVHCYELKGLGYRSFLVKGEPTYTSQSRLDIYSYQL